MQLWAGTAIASSGISLKLPKLVSADGWAFDIFEYETACAALPEPGTDKAAFELIRSYSPYDNVRAQAYPPMLVTAGLNDPRVTYWEPAKWVARLRATRTDDNVLLLKTNMGAGHGGKSGRWESLKETAEEYAFILWQMGHADAAA